MMHETDVSADKCPVCDQEVADGTAMVELRFGKHVTAKVHALCFLTQENGVTATQSNKGKVQTSSGGMGE